MDMFTLAGKFVVQGADEVNRQIDNTTNKARNSESKFGSSFSNIASNAMSIGSKVVGFGTGIIQSSGIVYNSQMESLQASFETMMGSTEKATNHMNDLKRFAAATPFELGDLARASQTLQSFGVENQKLMPDIKMLGDISQGNKEKFNGLSLVFGQVASQGKLMGGDLLQMINNGFNPLQIMSQKTGKSMSTLKDEMAKGKISFNDVEKAMVTATSKGGMFYGAMEKQSTTFAGKMSTLKDNFNEFAGAVSKPIFDALKGGMDGVMKFFTTLTREMQAGNDFIDSFHDAIAEAFGENTYKIIMGVVSALTALGVALAAMKTVSFISGFVQGFISLRNAVDAYKKANELATFAQAALNMAMEANPIGIIIGLVSALVGGIVYLWTTNEHFRAVVVSIWDGIKAYFNTVVSFWQNIFTVQIPNFLNSLQNFFTNLWNNIVQICTNALNNISNFFSVTIPNIINNVGNWFAQLPTRIGNAINSVLTTIGSWGSGVYNYFATNIPMWINAIGTWFSQLPYKVGYAIGLVLGTIKTWASNVYNFLLVTVPHWVDSVGTWFSQLPPKIWNWLVATYTKITVWGQQMYAAAVFVGTRFVNSIVTWFQQLPSKIYSFVSNAYNRVVTWGSQMYSKAVEVGTRFVNGIVTWLQQLPSKIQTFLSNTITNAANFVRNFGQKAIEAGKTFLTNITNGVKEIPHAMLSIGGDIVHGIWSGISGAAGWLADKVKSFAHGVVDGLKHAAGINSPSTLFRDEVGIYLAQGIGVGFSNEMDNVKSSMSDTMNNLNLDKSIDINGNVNASGGGASSILNTNKQMPLSQQPIVIEIDGYKVFQALSPHMAMAGKRVR